MNLIRKLKNLWKLADTIEFDESGAILIYADDEETGRVRQLATRRALLPPVVDKILGDGKAVFLGEGTEEEYEEHLKDEQGWNGLLKKWKLK